MNIKTSLIVSTYNWEAALELCLHAVLKQTRLPDEVIIADDGSGAETAQLIQRFQGTFPIPLHHCWQEDKGFRAAAIRNKAIKQAIHPLIIQIDGDIIMHPRFVEEHIRFARPRFYTRGIRAFLSESETRSSLQNKTCHFQLFRHPLKKWPNAISVPLLQRFFSIINFKGKGAIGCNLSYWRADAIKINGYNNDFTGWGKEDDEFCLRLENAGIRKRTLKFGAIAYHLHHRLVEREQIQENIALLEETRLKKIKICKNGIELLSCEDYEKRAS